MRRNILEVYNSLCIQKKLNLLAQDNKIKVTGTTYHSFDTSEVKVYFDQDEFTKLRTRFQNYYSFLAKFAAQSPEEFIHLDYQDLHKHESNNDKLSFLIDSLTKKGFDIDKNQDAKKLSFLKKQDSRMNILDKFENPVDVELFLEKNNIELF